MRCRALLGTRQGGAPASTGPTGPVLAVCRATGRWRIWFRKPARWRRGGRRSPRLWRPPERRAWKPGSAAGGRAARRGFLSRSHSNPGRNFGPALGLTFLFNCRVNVSVWVESQARCSGWDLSFCDGPLAPPIFFFPSTVRALAEAQLRKEGIRHSGSGRAGASGAPLCVRVRCAPRSTRGFIAKHSQLLGVYKRPVTLTHTPFACVTAWMYAQCAERKNIPKALLLFQQRGRLVLGNHRTMA